MLPTVKLEGWQLPAASTAKAASKRTKRVPLAPRKPVARSRISNGNSLYLRGLDGRSSGARFYHDRITELVAMLGGPDEVSPAEISIVRGVARMELDREQMASAAQDWEDSDGKKGRPLNTDAFGRLCSRIGRELQRLGLRRRPKDVTPSVRAYARQQQEAAT
jgi:hypothetical protein